MELLGKTSGLGFVRPWRSAEPIATRGFRAIVHSCGQESITATPRASRLQWVPLPCVWLDGSRNSGKAMPVSFGRYMPCQIGCARPCCYVPQISLHRLAAHHRRHPDNRRLEEVDGSQILVTIITSSTLSSSSPHFHHHHHHHYHHHHLLPALMTIFCFTAAHSLETCASDS